MAQLQAQYQDMTIQASTTVDTPSSTAAQQMQAEGVLMTNNNQGQELESGGPQENCSDVEDNDSEGGTVIERANMWTRSDMKLFKTEVSAGKGDGVIRVGHGETVTVRVPTHEGGHCLFWEFATDTHDLGFGVYFEWSKPMTTEVSVHISESDEEDDEDPGEEGDGECEYCWGECIKYLIFLWSVDRGLLREVFY